MWHVSRLYTSIYGEGWSGCHTTVGKWEFKLFDFFFETNHILRWVKQDVLDIFMAEYDRLGRPLDDADLNPDHIVGFVGQHFESAGAAPSFAEPPRPPAAAAAVDDASVQTDLFYVVNAVSGEWEMHAFALDGQLVQTVTLPDPGVGGYYTMLFNDDAGFNLLASNQQVPIPCYELLLGGVETESSMALPPGVSASAAMLPGMAKAGRAELNKL